MYFIVRRYLDVFFAFLLILLLSPLLLLIALAIMVDSKGPVIFQQKRLGKDGREFVMYKFRTMIENAENMGTGLFNYKGDFRVTRVGKILRLTSMDELPQLINILKGDMTFVGPRPPVNYELGKYEDLPDEFKNRFTVLPGVTGFAQVYGRNELSWHEKVKYDNEYINKVHKWGPLIDIKIVLLTFVKIVSMKGIYELEEDNQMDSEEDNSIRK